MYPKKECLMHLTSHMGVHVLLHLLSYLCLFSYLCMLMSIGSMNCYCQSSFREESFLGSVTFTSSSCTGSFSGEMALAVVEKTINKSGILQFPVFMTPLRCHDTLQQSISRFFIFVICFLRSIKSVMRVKSISLS